MPLFFLNPLREVYTLPVARMLRIGVKSTPEWTEPAEPLAEPSNLENFGNEIEARVDITSRSHVEVK